MAARVISISAAKAWSRAVHPHTGHVEGGGSRREPAAPCCFTPMRARAARVAHSGRMDRQPRAAADPVIAAALGNERARQATSLNLIASESVPSPAVLETLGSILVGKYAEG